MSQWVWIEAIGESDCELIGDGALAQPVNALSSFAFSIVGLALVGWARRASGNEHTVRWALVGALVGTGIGSFLYHGPQTTISNFAHDITFLIALFVVAFANLGAGLGWTPRVVWGSVGGATIISSVALALFPGITNGLTALGVAALVAGDIALRRVGSPGRPWYALSLISFGLAMALLVAGRSGGPLCDPSALLQPHAAWHVLGAVGIGLYAIGTGDVRVNRVGGRA
ncbi:MAG TPA: hypothetical protein VLA29_02565 [Acidimicrobiia bacterium]|nr:hypothetical protein [Acidimicrobiia bacterium]